MLQQQFIEQSKERHDFVHATDEESEKKQNAKKMNVLIACEFSGIIRGAFRDRGHNAWSCDLLPSESEGNHIQDNILKHLSNGWDLMIAHPPCTYLSYVGTRHWDKPGRKEKREEAFELFMSLINAPIDKICVENPVGCPNTVYRKPDQIIHPYYFGNPYMKRTCLWLKGLPKLEYANTIIEKPKPLYHLRNGKGIHWVEGIKGVKNRSQERSRTFEGVAKAMAEQWG